ncbi:MAG TPA: winged helix-turn-helix domain-containing protein [Steroidobacteraceae bacterium]|nr:winged helix-turn-helix domain-containing protein [Steroidobacteraceae bacterium]
MDQGTTLRIGDWCVNPASGQISREGQSIRVEARTMRLLTCLADHAGEIVSIDDLLEQVWSGVIVTPDSVYQAVALLRRLLGDDPKQPIYIATVPRLGYRMVASVSPWVAQSLAPPLPATELTESTRAMTNLSGSKGGRHHQVRYLITAGAALCLALVVGFVLYGKVGGNDRAASTPAAALQDSVAVLPFLDLTSESMDQEYFADGMTEELIDGLSKIPGLRVPPPTSSFYFKGKKVPIAEIARSLGVAYVLDGSLRKSGPTMRVSARLVRADSGFVVWSETYERPMDDSLKVQDDIAGEVIKALRPSIDRAAQSSAADIQR